MTNQYGYIDIIVDDGWGLVEIIPSNKQQKIAEATIINGKRPVTNKKDNTIPIEMNVSFPNDLDNKIINIEENSNTISTNNQIPNSSKEVINLVTVHRNDVLTGFGYSKKNNQ